MGAESSCCKAIKSCCKRFNLPVYLSAPARVLGRTMTGAREAERRLRQAKALTSIPVYSHTTRIPRCKTMHTAEATTSWWERLQKATLISIFFLEKHTYDAIMSNKLGKWMLPLSPGLNEISCRFTRIVADGN